MSIKIEKSHQSSEDAAESLSEGFTLVEVAVNSDGRRVPMGLMNTDQALSLPEEISVEVSHPHHEAGATDTFITRDKLKEYVEAHGERVVP